jgi:hypothetical protein
MQKTLDNIDIRLLEACRGNPGKAQTDLIASFSERSYRALCYRVTKLEKAGMIRIDRASDRSRSLCYITNAGKEALVGRENIPTKNGGDLLV